MLIDPYPRRMLRRFVPDALPPPGSFNGQTVLVTGGTSGMGLAAATHFASLGAEVIITCRKACRGQAAQRKIEEVAGITGKGKVAIMELDMCRYASCVAFVEALKKKCTSPQGLDVAVMNAGSITPEFTESPEGWEQTIQVNTLSTTLIGLLILSWMKESRPHRIHPAHLAFVSSREHLYPNIKHWDEWAEKEGILRHFSSKENWPSWWSTFEPNYAISKLLLMYTIANLSKMALGLDGELEVIVTDFCPGLVQTDIGRSIVTRSWLVKLTVCTYLGILGKSPETGSRIYVTAARRTEEQHGKFFNVWLPEKQYRKKAVPNITSDRARKVEALVWEEIIEELTTKVPTLQQQWFKSDK